MLNMKTKWLNGMYGYIDRKNCLTTDSSGLAFVIKLAVAMLGNFYAKPLGHGNAAQANVSLTPTAR